MGDATEDVSCVGCNLGYAPDGPSMIECSACKVWFHDKCVSRESGEGSDLEEDWFCPKCTSNKGKRGRKRKNTESDSEPEPVVSIKSQKLSAYEELRQANIRKNQELLAELMITEAKRDLADKPAEKPPRKRQRVASRPQAKPAVGPVRVSRRLANQSVENELEENAGDPAEGAVAEKKKKPLFDDGDTDFYWQHLWFGSHRKNFKMSSKLPENYDVTLPFTLVSIGTTVHELGRIHTGPWARQYWAYGCTHSHPYPIGYHASRLWDGDVYHMRIHEGDFAPVFEVSLEGGKSWSAVRPSEAWAAACKSKTRTGKRVSGPLYYGFSDPIVIRLIQGLPGYTPLDQLPPDPVDTGIDLQSSPVKLAEAALAESPGSDRAEMQETQGQAS